jgi:hypothetical protein
MRCVASRRLILVGFRVPPSLRDGSNQGTRVPWTEVHGYRPVIATRLKGAGRVYGPNHPALRVAKPGPGQGSKDHKKVESARLTVHWFWRGSTEASLGYTERLKLVMMKASSPTGAANG